MVAHRGLHVTGLPENSLPAVAAAIRSGADMVELDVRRTRDGVLVLHHDARVGNRIFGPRVSDLTYGELARRSPDGAGLTRLEDAARMARGRVPLDVELKEAGSEGEVVSTLQRAMGGHPFVVKSFRPDSVQAIEAMSPRVATGLLTYDPPLLRAFRSALDPGKPVRDAQASGADFVAIHDSVLSAGLLDAAAAARIPVFVWTVNDPARLQQLTQQGRVAAVITDLPNHALRARQQALLGSGALPTAQ